MYSSKGSQRAEHLHMVMRYVYTISNSEKQGGHRMGLFAAELDALLCDRRPAAPWEILAEFDVHPAQIERLRQAAMEIGVVATLPQSATQQLKQRLALSPYEWARLQAGAEADTFFRLLTYHNYPLEEAANKTNAVFAAVLKDKLAMGGRSESIYPTTPALEQVRAHMPIPRRRGRRPTVSEPAAATPVG
jgi:hypothetical protein